MATLLDIITQLEADNAAMIAHVDRLVKENERLRQVGGEQAVIDRLELVRGNTAKALNSAQASFAPPGSLRPGNTGFRDVPAAGFASGPLAPNAMEVGTTRIGDTGAGVNNFGIERTVQTVRPVVDPNQIGSGSPLTGQAAVDPLHPYSTQRPTDPNAPYDPNNPQRR